MDINLVSWNIAGGRTQKSFKLFDYQKSNLNYFAKEILRTSAEIICIQEMESDRDNDLIHKFADLLETKNVYFLPNYLSRINKDNYVGNAIFSKYKIHDELQIMLPKPDWDMYWPDGRPVAKYDKKIIACTIEGVNLVNIHMEPLGLWGFNYYEEPGLNYAKQVENKLINMHRLDVICGDFSGDFPDDNVGKIFTNLFQDDRYRDALPNEITRPLTTNSGRKNDHIFLSREFKVKSSKIISTKSDHYLCYAKISTM